MTIKVGSSQQKALSDNIAEITEQCGMNAKLVVYFVSPIFDGAATSAAIQSAFPGAQTIGCSTSGEIVTGKMLNDSIVAMALDDDEIESAHVELIENISSDLDVSPALAHFEEVFGVAPNAMSIQDYFGLIMVDGLSIAEEKVMDKLGNQCDIQIVGGAAGDELKFEKTMVYANGRAVSNAAALAIVKPKCQFEVVKTQSFEVQETTFVATKVNEATRKVIEFNGRSAAEVYAEAVGTTPDNIAEFFMSNTVGLMVGDEPYVRSPQQSDGSSITFYCNIKEGMELKLLKSGNIVTDTGAVLDACAAERGTPRAIINFHCILRTLELQHQDLCGPYGELFNMAPTIGFSTYGEEYIGHINQTSTMVLLR